MRKYKEFINEGIDHILSPKSNDDIEKSLNKLDVPNRIAKIYRYKLDKKYMPSDEEIQDYLDNFNGTPFAKYKMILRLKLPEKYLDKEYFILKNEVISKIKNQIKNMCDQNHEEPPISITDDLELPILNLEFEIHNTVNYHKINLLYYDGVEIKKIHHTNEFIKSQTYKIKYEDMNLIDLTNISNELYAYGY